MQKRLFLAWARYHRRSELLALHLNADLHYVYSVQKRRSFGKLVGYVRQAYETWHILHKKRPDVILIQNPPIFAVLVAYCFTKSHGGRFVIDSHTGAFLSSPWSSFVWLHQILSRRALTTIVHNKSQEEILKRWECRHIVVAFTPGDYSKMEDYPLSGKFSVAVVSTYQLDEPLDVVFEVASQLPAIDFYVTGNHGDVKDQMLQKKPTNCFLTGYLSYPQYVGLLSKADVVLDLTTRNHTLLMGGFEAVSVGTPLITSDWPVLKDYFSLGTVHVPNTVEGIRLGILRAQSENSVLRGKMKQLQLQLQAEWEEKLEELQGLLNF